MDNRFNTTLRIISTIVLCFFTWSFGGVVEVVYAFKNSDQPSAISSQTTKPKTQKPEEKFQEALEKIKDAEERADKKIQKGENTEPEEKEVKNQKAEIERHDTEIRKQFRETEEKIKSLPEEIKKRHKDFVKKYDENLKTLKANLDDIDRAKTKPEKELAHKKTKEFLEKTKPPSRHTPLDPNKLPHRTAEPTKREPRTKPEEFTEGKELRAKGISQKPILVAANGPLNGLLDENSKYSVNTVIPAPYQVLGKLQQGIQTGYPIEALGYDKLNSPSNPDTSGLLNSGAEMLLALADPPTSADISETIEVQFTPEIKAKAEELGKDPVKIYNWVRNNIEFVPTYGSIQGASMCLQTKQCNDFDTASLLIALLRASGIPAKYVYGTIELPIDKVMNWVGGFTDAKSAVNFIASGGVPIKAYTSGGKIAKVQMEHVWVETYVPYGPYSGRLSNLNATKTWIPLDSSYKQYNYTQGIDLQAAVPFDAQSFIDQLKSTATINETEGYVTNVNSNYIQTTLTDYQTQLQNYINQNIPNATVGDILGMKEIKKQELGILPATLPYKKIVAGTKYSELPHSLRHKITFEIQDTYLFQTALSYTASIPELTGKKITLSYAPATTTDEQTINSYGGIYNVPAYLVNMKPQIKVEGVVKATGGSIGLGNQQTFDMKFTSLSYGADIVSNQVTAGAYYGIGFNPYKISKGLVEKRKLKLEAVQSTVSSSNIYTDEYIGELLYTTAITYFFELDAFEDVFSKSYKVANVKQVSEGMVSKDISVSYTFGIPIKALEGGLTIDVDRYIHSPVSISGDTTKTQQFMLSLGQISSGMEHGIFEQLYNKTGTSAVKALSVANSQGIPIYTMNANNMANVLPALQVSDQVKTDIQNAVNAGKIVTVSKTNVTIGTWNGVGYIILEQNTGAAAYMISDGFAGGEGDVSNDEIVSSWQRILMIIASTALVVSGIMMTWKVLLAIFSVGIIKLLIFAPWGLLAPVLLYLIAIILIIILLYIIYSLILDHYEWMKEQAFRSIPNGNRLVKSQNYDNKVAFKIQS